MILVEQGPKGQATVFDGALDRVVAWQAHEVGPALAALDRARAQGHWVAGWIAYEAGYALEPRLEGLMPPHRPGPLISFGVFAGPQAADPLLAQARAEAAVRIAPVEPLVSQAAYFDAFDRVKAYIAAGDCYQINLTFPMRSTLVEGTALGLYGALRAKQAVGYGAFVDLGGPVLISRSPELFLRTDAAGRIESRPMKGTAPRDADPVRDAELAEELRASDKGRAENLMIVDLLRNDISRIARVGSVKVPALFAVESYATLHQMISRVVGEMVAPPSMAGLMPALFPCGSITGAPKIRAMQIIREVEPEPRGAYCGAIGWMAPDGASCFSVAIRTLTLNGRAITLNVGGGVVQDSTAQGEWEEAHWKARYLTGLQTPG
ncbi:aminodeoxychorismate synthase component I [bacterium]|nr:aminodeoxychorismate synthase component I [bacterium]